MKVCKVLKKPKVMKKFDVSELTFDVVVVYDCKEGEGIEARLDGGSWDEAAELFRDLGFNAYNCYYRSMALELAVRQKNGRALNLQKVLDGDYGWLSSWSTSSEVMANDLPEICLKFLEDLKNGEEARALKELEEKAEKLKAELAAVERKLAKMRRKK